MAFSGFLLALFCRAFGFLRICEDDGSSSIDVSVFISETFLPGNVNRSISEPIPVQDDDQSMKVSGFLKTRAWGIVSLAGALESMNKDTIQQDDLTKMFPSDSILVVNEAYFGFCLENAVSFDDDSDIPFQTETFRNLTKSGDGYIIIDSAVFTSEGAVVTGSQTAFYNMFDDANILIFKEEDPEPSRRMPFEQVWEVEALNLKPDPFVTISLVGRVIARTDLKNIQVSFGLWGFNLSVELYKEDEIQATVETAIEVGVSTPVPFWRRPIHSKPVYPPVYKILKLLKKTGLFHDLDELPEGLKVGVFFELDLLVELTKAALTVKFGPSVDYRFNSGLAVIRLDFWHLSAVGAGIRHTVTVTEAISPPTVSLDYGIAGFQEPATIQVNLFLGLEAKLFVYATEYVAGGISDEFGYSLNTKTPVGDGSLVPVSPLGTFFGPCHFCHNFEAELFFVVKPPRVKGAIKIPGTKLSKLDVPLVPGVVELRQKTLTACAWGEIEITCGDGSTCCDSSPLGICLSDEQICCYPGDECCFDDDCNESEKCVAAECVDRGCPAGEKLCNGGCILDNEQCCYPEAECCIDADCVEEWHICFLNSCVLECTNGTKICDNDCIPMEEQCCKENFCCDNDPCCDESCHTTVVHGDPHVVTFDAVRYSCQAQGVFVLFHSTGGIEAQAYFKKRGALVSLPVGLAVRSHAGGNLIELVILEAEGTGGSQTVLLVNGTPTSTPQYEDEMFRVTTIGLTTKIWIKSSSVSVYAKLNRPIFSPHFGIRLTIPPTYSQANAIIGILGSPNGNPNDDWMDVTGAALGLPSTSESLVGQEAFDYCITNWCVTNENQSLFTPASGIPFNGTSDCSEGYPGAVDLGNLPAELEKLCGSDLACLMDGVELGIESALDALESEALVTSSSRLQVSPSSIIAGQAVNVIVTIDLSKPEEETPTGLEYFQLSRLNPVTRQGFGGTVMHLLDSGSELGDDAVADDGVYSCSLAIRSDLASELFGFRTVPVIDGAVRYDSHLVVDSLIALRSYSSQSGIGVGSNTSTQIRTLDSIDEVVLIVEYVFPYYQSYLKSGIYFLNASAGSVYCDNNPTYLTHTRNTYILKSRVMSVKLGDSYDDGQWVGSVDVSLRAEYYADIATGPISVTVSTETAGVPDQNAMSFVAEPGYEVDDDCASIVVGTVNVEMECNIFASDCVKITVVPGIATADDD